MVDSLGAYKAASWYIDEHTSQIHVGLPDAVSRQGLVKAAIRIGVPTDAVVASLVQGRKRSRRPSIARCVRLRAASLRMSISGLPMGRTQTQPVPLRGFIIRTSIQCS